LRSIWPFRLGSRLHGWPCSIQEPDLTGRVLSSNAAPNAALLRQEVGVERFLQRRTSPQAGRQMAITLPGWPRGSSRRTFVSERTLLAPSFQSFGVLEPNLGGEIQRRDFTVCFNLVATGHIQPFIKSARPSPGCRSSATPRPSRPAFPHLAGRGCFRAPWRRFPDLRWMDREKSFISKNRRKGSSKRNQVCRLDLLQKVWLRKAFQIESGHLQTPQ